MNFLFGECAIDVARRELKRSGKTVAVEPQVFDLLIYLIENRDRVVSRDDILAAVWHGRIVSESTVGSRINAARQAIGDDGKQQQFIRTVVRRGFRFVGDVKKESPAPDNSAAAAVPQVRRRMAASGPAPAQRVSICKTSDGVDLAVATTGDGLPVIKTANWLNHLEYDWESPIWSPMFSRLSARFRLIRYDERGNGLSDWHVPDISFEAFVSDLEAVVDGLGLERFALFGVSQGAAVSATYAARHPHRVSRLVLWGGYVQGWRKRGNAAEMARREALLTLVQHGWGQDNPAFRQIFSSLFFPGATPQETHWFNELQRITTSPENAIRILNVLSSVDVSDVLPQVRAPTLILHSRGDGMVPFEQGLKLARGITNARFVALDTPNHLILEHEPAWRRLMDQICDFLDEDRKRPSHGGGSALAPGADLPGPAERFLAAE